MPCALLRCSVSLTLPCSTLRATLAGGGRAGSGRDSRDYSNAVSRKVCVLGYMGVGKSSLTIQYAEGQFIDAYSPTIENTFQKLVKHRDTEYVLPFPLCIFVTLWQVPDRDPGYGGAGRVSDLPHALRYGHPRLHSHVRPTLP